MDQYSLIARPTLLQSIDPYDIKSTILLLNQKHVSSLAVVGLAAAIASSILILKRPTPDPISKNPKAREDLSAQAQITPPAPLVVSPRTPSEQSAPVLSRARLAFNRVLEALRHGDRDRIKAALEELRAECEPPWVPEAANAALLYKKAFEAYQEGNEPTDEEMESMDRLSHGFAITAEERANLQAVLNRSHEVLRLLHEASDLPGCNFRIDSSKGMLTQFDHSSGICRCSRLLSLESLLHEGPDASEPLRAASRLAEAGADEPYLLSKLVRSVGFTITNDARQREFEGELSPERLHALLSSAAPETTRSGLEKTFLFEIYGTVKAVIDGLDIEHTLEGREPKDILPPGAPGNPRLEDPLLAVDLVHYGELLSEYGALAERPYYQVHDELDRVDSRLNGFPGFMTDTIKRVIPAFKGICERLAKTEATLGTAQVAAALRLCRDAQGGEYPASLDELRALLPSPPIDPFTGKAYLYRREGAGFVVYSAGPDGNSSGVSGDSDILFRSPR